ncbi:MAG: aldolase/citrate lyase family protein [Ornithinimicrobium sp.]
MALPQPVQDVRATLQASSEGVGDGLRRGLWLTFLDPYGLEVASDCGADWISVDLQHGTAEVHHLPGLLRVAEAAGLPMMARVGSHDPLVLGQVLDTGVSGVIIPMVESADQARALVAACRTPPVGTRSTGASRSALGVSHAPELPLTFHMVETAAGVEHAAEILAVPGVDGVFFGPYDFSISAGYPGPGSAETINALRHVIGLARAAGKFAGFMAGQPELVAVAPEADLVAVDTDVSALRLGLARVLARDT